MTAIAAEGLTAENPCMFPSGCWKQMRICRPQPLSLAADGAPFLPALSSLSCECLSREAYNMEAHGVRNQRDRSREAKQTPGLWTQISEVASRHVCHSLLISTISRSNPHLERGPHKTWVWKWRRVWASWRLSTTYFLWWLFFFCDFFSVFSPYCCFPTFFQHLSLSLPLYLAPCLHSHHAHCCPLVCIHS